MRFRDLSLGNKQRVGFAIILAIMVGGNAFTLNEMAGLKSGLDDVTANRLPVVIAIGEINLNTTLLRLNQLQYTFTTEEAGRDVLAEAMIALIDKIGEGVDTYEAITVSSDGLSLKSQAESTLYDGFIDKWEAYQDYSLSFYELTQTGKNAEAVALLNGEARDVFNNFSSDLISLVQLNQADALNAAAQAGESFQAARNVALLQVVVTFLLSIVIVMGLVRYITVPIHQLEQAAGDVAEGDLTVHLDIPGKDEIGRMAGSFNHMTEALRSAREQRIQQEEALRRQNEDLEQAMRDLEETQHQLVMKEKMASLGDLVAGIAHEINNPIGVINGSADVSRRCAERIDALVTEGANSDDLKGDPRYAQFVNMLKENIGVITTAGDRIATIVKSLTIFAGLDKADYQRVDIHEGLDSCVTLLENELGNIQVERTYGAIPEIACYPSRLNQAFLSLMRNAVHALDGKGVLGIKTSLQEEKVLIEISDTGRGIPKDKLDTIFDFGFSSDGERVKMRSSLSSVYQVVQRHHGEVDIASELNAGTTVSVLLPLNDSRSQE
jgi:signal transduction histidine kinase